ncbi:MAG: MerR family transcriptional regulator [Bacteriovoracaceae bacterium]|nr:MerR family transcriptional regulator [Bacteriovoracaceae bacterium]
MDQVMSGPIEIPNKSTFKINEVCALTGIKSYVLRFWETEFVEIAPIPSSSGQKLYELKDIEAILLIKKLLFDDKLSIEKAKSEVKKLLPDRKLLDERFLESTHQEASSEVRKFQPEILSAHTVINSPSSQEQLPEVPHFTTRSLTAVEFRKLVNAKDKLNEMLSFINQKCVRN